MGSWRHTKGQYPPCVAALEDFFHIAEGCRGRQRGPRLKGVLPKVFGVDWLGYF
jgi:hypothetical protein